MQTRSLALVVDQELSKAEILLQTLAGSASLARGDLAAFRTEATAASAIFANAPIGLMGADRRPLLNVPCPQGGPESCARVADPLPAQLASGRAEITDLVQGPVTGRLLIAVGVPVFAPGHDANGGQRLAYTLGLALPPGLIASALSQRSTAAGHITTVLDRTGAVVARSEGEAASLGQHLRPELMAAIAESPLGIVHGLRTLQGMPSVMVFARAPRSGFVVVANVPESQFAASLWAALTRIFGIGLLVLAAGLGSAVFLGRRIAASLRRLATVAVSGKEPPQDDLREVNDLAQVLAETGAERDRTEASLREDEERLRKNNETLEARVAQEVEAREAAQARLAVAQRMQALGQLAGGVAHDFNNVLQAICSGTRLIYQRAGDPEAIRRLAATVGDAADRGAAVTRRLLAFAQRSDLLAEPLDAAQVLAALQEVLAHTLGGNMVVNVEADAGLPPLLADRGQLETVLVNLATNARDAMQPGGGVLTLVATSQEVVPDHAHPAALRPGRYVCFSVSDTGTGMDASTLARASEPFFTTKPVGKGTGLGLAMAQGFAEQSGGALLITSTLGGGTTVLLWLPQAEVKETAAPAKPRRTAPAIVAETRKPRILLVDDDFAVRELVAEELTGRDYHVEQAGDGAEALERFGDGMATDLLVTDLSMPGMDGLKLIDEVRRRRPGLPAILLTGYAGDGVPLAAASSANAPYALLTKPVRAVQLSDCIARLLDKTSTLQAPLTMDRRRDGRRSDRRSPTPPTLE